MSAYTATVFAELVPSLETNLNLYAVFAAKPVMVFVNVVVTLLDTVEFNVHVNEPASA